MVLGGQMITLGNYSMGENICVLPSDMNLNVKTGIAGYNNKIVVSNGKFSLGKNDKVNALELAVPQKVTKISHKVMAQPTTTHGLSPKPAITHKEERVALILSIVGFVIWHMFR